MLDVHQSKTACKTTYHVLAFNNRSTANVGDHTEWLFVREQVCVQAGDVSELSNRGFYR